MSPLQVGVLLALGVLSHLSTKLHGDGVADGLAAIGSEQLCPMDDLVPDAGGDAPVERLAGDAVETAEHAKGLLVADDLNAGIVFSDERDRTAVVGFHVVDDKVVDGAVADHLMDVLEKLGEEINFNRIDEAYLLIINEIGVVGHTIGQWPEPFEESLVAVVDAHVIDVIGDCCHIMIRLLGFLICKKSPRHHSR